MATRIIRDLRQDSQGEIDAEEMLMDEEGLQSTSNGLIHIGKPIVMDYDEFAKNLSALYEACSKDDEEIRQRVAAIVPTYKPGSTGEIIVYGAIQVSKKHKKKNQSNSAGKPNNVTKDKRARD